MSEIKYYSEEGLQKLKDELHHLIAFERPAAAAAIAEARDKGRSYLCDKVMVSSDTITDMATLTATGRTAHYRLPSSRAMRYVTVE
jgi:hypothetical protein